MSIIESPLACMNVTLFQKLAFSKNIKNTSPKCLQLEDKVHQRRKHQEAKGSIEPTSWRTSLINCSALAICSEVPMSSTILFGEFGSASTSRVTWILAPDWSWRYFMVSPPLPMITPTLIFGISIFLLVPWKLPYERGIDEGSEPERGFPSALNQSTFVKLQIHIQHMANKVKALPCFI